MRFVELLTRRSTEAVMRRRTSKMSDEETKKNPTFNVIPSVDDYVDQAGDLDGLSKLRARALKAINKGVTRGDAVIEVDMPKNVEEGSYGLEALIVELEDKGWVAEAEEAYGLGRVRLTIQVPVGDEDD
jgi:hypothetical protein